jgi:hypothetical protein
MNELKGVKIFVLLDLLDLELTALKPMNLKNDNTKAVFVILHEKVKRARVNLETALKDAGEEMGIVSDELNDLINNFLICKSKES